MGSGDVYKRQECWFWMCSRPWLGVRSIDKLLGYFKTAKNIYYGRNSQYTEVKSLSENIRKRLEQCGDCLLYTSKLSESGEFSAIVHPDILKK